MSNNTTPLTIDETTQSSILASLHELKEDIDLLPNYVDLKHVCSEILTCIDQVQNNNPLAARLSAHKVNIGLVSVLREFNSNEDVFRYLAPCFDGALSVSTELEHIATSELLSIRPVEHFLTEGAL